MPGLDSSVISQSVDILKNLFICPSILSNACNGISDGVPPPKNIVGISIGPSMFPQYFISDIMFAVYVSQSGLAHACEKNAQ